MAESRNYKIDLLRAASMLLIVIQHYVVWGVKSSCHEFFHVGNIYGAANYLAMEALYLLSCIGVNCFVMISGYYMITRYEHRWKSLARMWLTTMVYSVILCIATSYLSGVIDKNELIGCFFPIWSYQYWFVTKYFGLMLLAPYIALMANRISRNQYKGLLCILFAMCFMFPYGNIYAGGQSILWMVFVFLTAGYVRLYGVNEYIQKRAGIISLLILAIYTVGVFGLEAYCNLGDGNIFGKYQLHSLASDSPIFFLSLSIFIFTTRNTDKKEWFIMHLFSKISPYILAVYLIHMNRNFYPYIWNAIIPESYEVPMFIHAIVSCSLIFVVCIAIDYVRGWCFEIVKVDYVFAKIGTIINKKIKR